jgi:regulator of protease activity HflC (stomatin/prohibitin superfamily)
MLRLTRTSARTLSSLLRAPAVSFSASVPITAPIGSRQQRYYRAVEPETPKLYERLVNGFVNLALSPFHLIGSGFLWVKPNHVDVATQFGKYSGKKYQTGLNWTPTPVGLKTYTVFLGEKTVAMKNLKIVDHTGNPLVVSGIMNYRITNPEQFLFGINDADHYIHNQADSILKNVVQEFTYNQLRQKGDELEKMLLSDAAKRLEVAGIEVSEFRLTDINYAKEIAQVMLVQQQAAAYNDAKREIVQAASEMAEAIVSKFPEMNSREKDQLIKNLIVVVTSGSNVQPVLPV